MPVGQPAKGKLLGRNMALWSLVVFFAWVFPLIRPSLHFVRPQSFVDVLKNSPRFQNLRDAVKKEDEEVG